MVCSIVLTGVADGILHLVVYGSFALRDSVRFRDGPLRHACGLKDSESGSMMKQKGNCELKLASDRGEMSLYT